MSKRSIRFISYAICLLLIVSLIMQVAFAAPAEVKRLPFAADTVYFNGNIYTVDEKFSKATAMAIKDGKFIFVGDDCQIDYFIDRFTKVIDLKGKTVIPGLIDSHLHYPGIGAAVQQIDCFWAQKEEILNKVAEAVKRSQPGEWIIGRG